MKQSAFKQLNSSLVITGKIFIFFLIFFYAIVNIFSSQRISPLYFQLAKENRDGVVDFLSKIKSLPVFNSFLAMNKNIYGNSLEDEVFAESLKRGQNIEEYELLLQKNPKSRDVLYNLYVLHLEDGNELKAEGYLKKTREIDPSIED